MDHEKVVTSQIDNIEQVSNDSSDVVDANERIIHELETHGEEVGMTFRTIMAAAVSIVGDRSCIIC